MDNPSRSVSEDRDFANAMLYGRDFSGSDLDGADFRYANLDRARLNNATLRRSNLLAARLCEASLRGANLEGANLRDAILDGTGVEGASFADADLRGATLHRLKDWRSISSIKGANIHGVREAPEGFVAWALGQGAIQEAPPPARTDRIEARLIALFSVARRALQVVNACLERLPFHTRQAHKRLARRGAGAILRWRTRNNGQHLNLEGASLSGAKLAGAPLAGSNMRAIDLSDADLSGAVLGQNLTDANLANADLRYATLSGDLRGANFHRARLNGALLMMADLDSADLRGAILEAADFSCAKLPRADLRDTDCRHTCFCDATLDGALLGGSCMTNANFYEARLRTCDLSDVELAGANLCNADLEGATNYDRISSIGGASIHGVRNAPDGFVSWAMENGAVQEHRNASWAPSDDLKARADRRREEIAEKNRANYGTHRILWTFVAIGLLFLVTGILGIFGGALVPITGAVHMRNWMETECVVTRSDYARVPTGVDPGAFGAYRFTPSIEYRYVWKGVEYGAQDYSRKPIQFDTEEEARALAARFPEAETRVCYVNARAPSQAVLVKQRFEWAHLLILALSTVWAFGGVIMLSHGFKHHDIGIY